MHRKKIFPLILYIIAFVSAIVFTFIVLYTDGVSPIGMYLLRSAFVKKNPETGNIRLILQTRADGFLRFLNSKYCCYFLDKSVNNVLP